MSERERILIVDDYPENITILANALKEYEKSVALNGEAALEAANSEARPDLILLDIMMPEMDGYEVCSRLKQHQETWDIPVIFVTALDEVENEARGFEVGAVDYLHKPIVPAVVQARVRNHLELARFRKELERQNQILKENEKLREHVEQITRHDLKTPLNALINIPPLILESEDLSEENRELLNTVRESSLSMLNMINSSQTLYKIESGRFELVPVPVDL